MDIEGRPPSRYNSGTSENHPWALKAGKAAQGAFQGVFHIEGYTCRAHSKNTLLGMLAAKFRGI